jgi:hypothetical protein
MTVKELRDKLARFDSNVTVVVQWEHGSNLDLFEIDDVTVSNGTQKRVEGKAGFAFDSEGKDRRVFLTVEPA